jgi:NTP pyrophosphatase (non-canonical NTP hydrolase)
MPDVAPEPSRGARLGAVAETTPLPPEPEIAELTRLVREFSTERDWQQFHDPKSVILALVGEVGELAELFQWVPAASAVDVFDAPDRRARAAEEMADVLVYLVCLADVLGVDLGAAARAKLADSHRRFAADEVRGRAPEKR